jgi:hypothetical protein
MLSLKSPPPDDPGLLEGTIMLSECKYQIGLDVFDGEYTIYFPEAEVEKQVIMMNSNPKVAQCVYAKLNSGGLKFNSFYDMYNMVGKYVERCINQLSFLRRFV